jgi:HSP20 family protein
MANERHSAHQEQQRPSSAPTESGESASGRGGRQSGTDVQRSPSGEYQRRGSWMPSLQSGFEEGPFAMMRKLSDEMDRLFEGFGMGRGGFPSLGRGGAGGEASLWSPHVEMCERGNKLVISADLPGIKREDVSVDVEQDGITIQGERRQESTSNERGWYRSERSYGKFHRFVPLPDGVNAESATATFKDGVLEIEMDAPQQTRGRRLEIKEGAGTAKQGAPQGGSSSGSTGTH